MADLLERVLDKGVVVAGDIKVSLLDIELLTIQIRLVVCSVDKAREMGMDWWANSPVFGRKPDREVIEVADQPSLVESGRQQAAALTGVSETLARLEQRLGGLERSLEQQSAGHALPAGGRSEAIDRGPNCAEAIDRGPIRAETIDRGPNRAETIDRGPIRAETIDRGPIRAETIDRGPIDAGPVRSRPAEEPPGGRLGHDHSVGAHDGTGQTDEPLGDALGRALSQTPVSDGAAGGSASRASEPRPVSATSDQTPRRPEVSTDPLAGLRRPPVGAVPPPQELDFSKHRPWHTASGKSD